MPIAQNGSTQALKITLRTLGVILLFGAGLFANDFISLRTWAWGHKTFTEIHTLEFNTIRRDMDKHITDQERTMELLAKIANKLEVD